MPEWRCRSHITLDVLFPAGATANAGDVILTDCLPIDSITLQTASGQILAQLQQTQIYTKSARWLCTDLEEYESRGGVFGSTAIGTGFPISELCGCQPYNYPPDAIQTSLQVPASIPSPAYVPSAGLVNVRPTTNVSGVDIAPSKCPQRLVAGAFAVGGDSPTQVRMKFKLDAFPGTILAMDRDICFGQNLQFEIYWKPIANWGTYDINTLANNNVSLPIPTISKFL